MGTPGEERRGQTSCAVDVSPQVVDAGAELTLQVTVLCAPVSDLRGHLVILQDDAGAEVGGIAITEFDGEANHGRQAVKAPLTTGEHTWFAVCPAPPSEGVPDREAPTPVSFTVTPHTTHVVAWDVPSAIEAGDTFRMKVGIKCSSECDMAKARFDVVDHEGATVATGTLAGDRWPGTTALHIAEADLHAPDAAGLYTWTVKAAETETALPHAEGSVSFGVTVVSHPEYLVSVEAVDQIDQTPIEGARVVMHPYRAVTDERGLAEMRVTRGVYKLFVSQTRYLTFGLPVEVTADVAARAELCLEPVPERN